jgi:MraZ protein
MANEAIDSDGGGLESSTTVVGVFVGFFLHSLDTKRRLTIPLGWRRQVGVPESLFVAPIHDKCLYVLTAREMVKRFGKSAGHSFADPEAASADRELAAQSELLEWDSQGRIRIRDELLEHAQLTDQVALVGAFERFEIWNPKTWEKYRAAMSRELADTARRLGF